MIEKKFNVWELVSKGDVVTASGWTVEEVFTSVCKQAKLPFGITAEKLVSELLEREKVLSTAIGKGIAIPHCRKPLLQNTEDCCVIVAYLKNQIDMQAPDSRKVSVLFILLSASSQFHIKALSSFASLFKNEIFNKELQNKPSKNDLVRIIKKWEETI